MKKTLFILLSITISSIANAQLKVNQFGNVTIGDDENIMHIGKTNINGSSHVYNTYLKSGRTVLRIDNKDETTPNRTGIQINNYLSPDTSSTGIFINTYNTSVSTAQKVYGIRCYAGGSSRGNYALAGCLRSNYITGGSGAGIYGSSNVTLAIPEQYAGLYAGFFRGDVRVTGTIYGTLLTPSGTSTNVTNTLDGTTMVYDSTDESENVSNKLLKVQLLQFSREQEASSESINGTKSFNSPKSDTSSFLSDEEGFEQMDKLESTENYQTKLSEIKYGLAADQLKEVFPELVYEDDNGNVSINYIEMVPLLVQSINELTARVEVLEAERKNLQSMKVKSKQAKDVDKVQLTIPDKAQKTTLNIFDLSGKQVRTANINESGNINLSTYTKGLLSGTYAYRLIVDGKKQKVRKIMVK